MERWKNVKEVQKEMEKQDRNKREKNKNRE